MADTSIARWRWSSMEQAYVWWDGREFTDGRAVFRDGRWCSTQPGVAPPDAPPPSRRKGRPDAVVPAIGEPNTVDATVPVAPDSGLPVGLAAAGLVLLVWGGFVATGSNAWSYPPEQRERYCTDPSVGELVPPLLWVIWIAMLAVAVASLTVAVRRDPKGPARWLGLLGLLSALVTFPLWLVVGVGMDCGL